MAFIFTGKISWSRDRNWSMMKSEDKDDQRQRDAEIEERTKHRGKMASRFPNLS